MKAATSTVAGSAITPSRAQAADLAPTSPITAIFQGFCQAPMRHLGGSHSKTEGWESLEIALPRAHVRFADELPRLDGSTTTYAIEPPTEDQDDPSRTPRAHAVRDGHGWQVMWMDPAAAELGPEAFAASLPEVDAAA